jgi:hypothetical protein
MGQGRREKVGRRGSGKKEGRQAAATLVHRLPELLEEGVGLVHVDRRER